MTEKVYVRNATNELKKVIVCSPKFYKFNGINEITKSWMEKGEKEHNELMVKEWQTLIDAYKENGVEVVEMEPQPELEVQTFARDFGAMIKEGAIIGKFRHPARQKETAVYEAKLKELGIPIVARCKGRASYLGERSIGHLDPGAVSSGYLFNSLLKAEE